MSFFYYNEKKQVMDRAMAHLIRKDVLDEMEVCLQEIESSPLKESKAAQQLKNELKDWIKSCRTLPLIGRTLWNGQGRQSVDLYVIAEFTVCTSRLKTDYEEGVVGNYDLLESLFKGAKLWPDWVNRVEKENIKTQDDNVDVWKRVKKVKQLYELEPIHANRWSKDKLNRNRQIYAKDRDGLDDREGYVVAMDDGFLGTEGFRVNWSSAWVFMSAREAEKEGKRLNNKAWTLVKVRLNPVEMVYTKESPNNTVGVGEKLKSLIDYEKITEMINDLNQKEKDQLIETLKEKLHQLTANSADSNPADNSKTVLDDLPQDKPKTRPRRL